MPETEGRDSVIETDSKKPYRFLLDRTVLRYRRLREPGGLGNRARVGQYELTFHKTVQSLVDNLAYIYSRIDVCVFSRQNPSLSREYYHLKPLNLQTLAYKAVDAAGRELTPEILHQYDSNLEFNLHFKNKKDGAFYIYQGETIEISSSFTISEEQWGPWLERHVRCGCDELSVELHFPKDCLRTIDGRMWSPTQPGDSLIRPRIVTKLTADESVHAWTCRSPELEARYRIYWAFADAREQKLVAKFRSDHSRRPVGFEIMEPDFSVVRWRGEVFRFSRTQAAAIRQLYHAWQKGYAPSGKRILEKIRSDLGLADRTDEQHRSAHLLRVFRIRKRNESPSNTYHPAWNKLILRGPEPGTFTLNLSVEAAEDERPA